MLACHALIETSSKESFANSLYLICGDGCVNFIWHGGGFLAQVTIKQKELTEAIFANNLKRKFFGLTLKS